MPALVDDDVQQLITKYGSRLQRLELDASGVTRPVIDAPLLQQLSLARCQGLLAATVHSPQLVELDLSHTFINSASIAQLCHPSPHRNTHARAPAAGSDLGATIKSLQQLVVLRLHGCRNIDSLPGSLPKVTLLDVTRTKVSGNAWRRFRDWLSLTHRLFVIHALQFTDTSIAEAVEGCPALTSLLLATCSKIVRPTLKSSSLETLTMYQCKNLAEPTLTGCDALQTLNLSETPIAGGECCVARVTLHAVVPLTLRLPGMVPSSAAFIRVFAQVPHLKSLAIANCHDIVDTPLLPTRDSGSASYSLTSLDARMCGIMDSSLSELAQCLPNLRYLNIRQCFNVAGGLRLVLPQLETLILQSSRVIPVQPAARPRQINSLTACTLLPLFRSHHHASHKSLAQGAHNCERSTAAAAWSCLAKASVGHSSCRWTCHQLQQPAPRCVCVGHAKHNTHHTARSELNAHTCRTIPLQVLLSVLAPI